MQPNNNQAKPTTGRLWYAKQLVADSQPFGFLQGLKKRLINQGYDKSQFKITY